MCCYAMFKRLNYMKVNYNTPVSEIPDPKWHFFEDHVAEDPNAIVANLSTHHPVLRYCVLRQAYTVWFRRGEPRFELLLLLQHTNGDHLVNLTISDANIFVNDIFYVKSEYNYPGNLSELYVEKKDDGFYVWARSDNNGYITIGNGDWDKAEYEWLYVTVDDKPCYEAKVKVAYGHVEFTVVRL
uniref:Galectin n=1 Tax=Panagrellus redivivus TaxID=6233 RepID=A0A7E4VLQ4_PANRE